MKAFLFSILATVAVKAHADFSANLPAGGKVSCKSESRVNFIREFATEMDNLGKSIKKALAENPKAKEDLETANIAGVPVNKDHVGDVSASVETDRNLVKLTMELKMSNAEWAVLVRHNILKRETQIDRLIVISGTDNCIIGL